MSQFSNAVVLITLALATACKDDPTGAAPSEHVYGGACTTTIQTVSQEPFVIHIVAACNLQQLGITSATFTETIDATGAFTSTNMIYIAANGDKLYARLVGQVTSPPGPDVVFGGTETFTGGTGRFLGVTGSSVFNGTATLNATGTGTGAYSSSGTFTY